MNISLTPEFEALIQGKIETGMYTNASEVIRDALRRMDENDHTKSLRAFMVPRLAEAEQGRFSKYNFDEIVARAKTQTLQDQ